MLGVNPTTLRQWTTAGKVQAYRTPGGHRRFNAAELATLQARDESSAREGVAASVVAQLRARYRDLARSGATHHGWLGELAPEARQQFHGLGDELLARLGEYLSRRPARARQASLARAREIARSYGLAARAQGIGPAQAVEAYLLFRRPLLDVLARSLAAHPDLGGDLSRIVRDAERFMDDVLSGIARASAGDGPSGAEPSGRATAATRAARQ